MKQITFTSPLYFLVLTIFCSCSDIEFQKPQPVWITKNEPVIPKVLHGMYADGKDTILISAKRIMDSKVNHDFDISLSDSVLLKIDNNTYFLNVFDQDKKNWVIIMAKADENRLLINMLSLKDPTVLKRLKKITSVKEIKDSNGKVSDCIIDPTAEEFHKMLDQNFFMPFDTLRKVN